MAYAPFNAALTKTFFEGDSGVNQQAMNTQSKTEYWNAANQGQYPNAQKGYEAAHAQRQAAGATPAPAPGAQAQAAPTQTFAQMQEQGQARPAPPTINPNLNLPGPQPFPGITVQPGMGGGGMTTSLAATAGGGAGVSPDVQAFIRQMMAQPSAYTDEQFNQNVLRHGQRIDDEFTQRERALQEDMVRRGLSESSIHGGRLRDTHIERRQAHADLVGQLAEQRARQLDEARARAASVAIDADRLGLEGQRLNLDAQRTGFEGQRLQLDQERARLDAFLRQEQAKLDREVASGRMSLDERRLEEDRLQRQADQEWRNRTRTEDVDWRNRQFDYEQGRDRVSDQRWEDQFRWGQQVWQSEWEKDLARMFGTGVVGRDVR